MKSIFNFLALFVILLFTLSCSEPKENILVTVGDHDITVKQFEDRYTDYVVVSGVEDNVTTRKAILNNMINEILLKEYDDNESVYNNKEFVKEKDWAYKQTLLAFLKDREVYGNISVSNEEIRDAFIKMNQTLTARHLYAATKEEADELYQLLQAGTSFMTLAKQTFTDSTLRNNGGYLGKFTWGDMDPTFEDTAYTLKVGEISKPVKTRTGYSIIKLEEKEHNPLLTEYQFQQKKSEIETTIKIRKKSPSERDFLESLYNKIDLKFNDEGVEQVSTYLKNDQQTPEDKKSADNLVVVSYEGKDFHVDEILNRINNLPAFHREKITSNKLLKAVIEGFIIQDILIETAKEKNYDEDEIMLKSYSTQLNNIFLKYKAEEIAAKVDIPDSTLRNYYREHMDFFSTYDEVNVQEIILKDKDLALNLLKKINAGKDFGTLAKQYSLREWSAKNNGEIGFAPLSKFGILKATFWNASVGDILGPHEIDGYYGLFKILGKNESKPIKFNLIRNEVLKVFREDRQNQLLLQYISHLRDKVNIYLDEKMLTSLKIGLLN